MVTSCLSSSLHAKEASGMSRLAGMPRTLLGSSFGKHRAPKGWLRRSDPTAWQQSSVLSLTGPNSDDRIHVALPHIKGVC
jgi:hypothetical protein